MIESKTKPTPEPTLRRLPKYLNVLTVLKEKNILEVSSTLIANELGLDPTQVRKDIQYTGIEGKPKTGFNTDELIKSIRSFLNWDNTTDAFIVGIGSLGTAILGYKQFKLHGINFVAAFDTDTEKIGQYIHGIPVLPIEKLTNLTSRMKVHIGVLTVPASAAQAVANMMIEGGIQAIWNFAPTHIKVPDNVIVENAQLTHSLAVITRKLSEYNFNLGDNLYDYTI
jgi:redox-sensing transcriptional repressor